MLRLTAIMALWLALLCQGMLSVAPQGATVWLSCDNPACPGVAPAARERCCDGCGDDDGGAPAGSAEGRGVRRAPPACCVAIVFPGSRGQPAAGPGAPPLPVPAALFTPAVAPALPPAADPAPWSSPAGGDGRPPPVAGLTVTSRLRL